MLLSIVACNDSENAESDTDPKGISIEETTVTVEDSGTEEPTTETDADTPSESEEKTEVTEKTETVEKTEITEKTETVEKTETTEKIETTQEETTQEAETLEPIHGYDFEDDSWSSLFDMAGSATRQITDDPAGSGKKVLSVVHDPSQSVSWIRNKTSFTMGEHTKFAVQVDLYIPSGTLSAAGDYVQMQINGEYNHHVNLVSDAKESLTPFDTKDFPRDKWFTVRFNFDMSKLRYDLEIVEDGEVRTIVFAGRSASSLAGQGPLNLRVFVSGAGQTIYIDHHGLETGRKGDEALLE